MNPAFQDEHAALTDPTRPVCKKCGHPQRKDCDGDGWLEPLGPYRDGSYISSRPCSNDNIYYAHGD